MDRPEDQDERHYLAAAHGEVAGIAVDQWLDAGAANCGRLIELVVGILDDVAAGHALGVVAYDPSSQVDLAAWCRLTGHQFLAAIDNGKHLEFVIRKRA